MIRYLYATLVALSVFLFIVLSGQKFPLLVDYEPAVATVVASEVQQNFSTRTEERATSTILFVGDIMLGRHVETLINTYDASYPFTHMSSYLSRPDITVGNFEGVITQKHVQTPSYTFQFSIRNDFLTHVKMNGFDILSLANNHSFDYGSESLAYTRSLCTGIGIVCGGSPNTIDEYSSHIVTLDNKKIGFIFLHNVTHNLDDEELKKLFEHVVENSDMQVVYIHWGTEYVLDHTESQEVLAEKLIDFGADAVVGHHPHVVEDIALYKGKPIFYSLGNFIFDQYFSTDVQEGLTVSMEITDTAIVYRLIPVSSKRSMAQPNFMNRVERQNILNRIMSTVAEAPEASVQDGTLTISTVSSPNDLME